MKFIAVLLGLATPAFAEDFGYTSNYGDLYFAEVNEHGVVLTSEFIKHYFIEAGAQSDVEDRHEVIYLGKSCDAEAYYWGKGRFGQANGGFIITFDGGHEIGFPRQELIAGLTSCPLE